MTVYRSPQACRLLAVDVILLRNNLITFRQQFFGGIPLILSEGSLRSLTVVRAVSLDFNLANFLSQDFWSETVQTKPLSVGHIIKHSASFAEDAEQVGIVAGCKIYRLQIELEGIPVGYNLCYEDFYIPGGDKLYTYSSEDRQMLGAYTYATHPRHGAFAAEPISGNTPTLGYGAPAVGEMPPIRVQGAGCFYRPALMTDAGAKKHIGSEDGSDPGLNKYCQTNANCSEGDPYQT